ncbi:MAG: HAD hydrolase-like protein, partial [Oscillospiraceae bacterium]|nr:HAD hydrolase-like protein [Oscillospiraceae bacterium]
GRGVSYIATTPDGVCPPRYGYVPDCGSVCEMLYRATGRRPYVIGKPKPDMAYLAMKAAGASPEETVVVGDRLYTDIACGVNAGVDTVLVLSGETKAEDVAASDVKPTFVLRDVKEYLELLQKV